MARICVPAECPQWSRALATVSALLPGGASEAGEIQRSAGVSGRRSRMRDMRGIFPVSPALMRVVPPSIRSLTGDGNCGVPPSFACRPRHKFRIRRQKYGRQENGGSDYFHGGRFRSVVHRRGEESGTHRLYQRQGMHGDQACGLCGVGIDSTAAGHPFQGGGSAERISAHVYSRISASEREGSCGRLRAGGGLGDPRRSAASAGAFVCASYLGDFVL